MSPPQLSGDAPVLDPLQPVEIGLAEVLRHKLQVAVLQGFDGRLRHLLHLHEPLLLHHGLHRGLAAVVGAHVVGVGNHLHQKSLLLQILHHGLSGLVAVHAEIFSGHADGGVVVHHADLRQIVAAAHLKVVGVVGGGDLHTARSKLLVHVLVGDHRDLPVREGELQHLSDEVLVALIVGIYRHSRISQHGLRAGGGDLHKAALLPHDGVVDVPEEAVLLLMDHLRVGDGSLTHRAPVDDPGPLVDISLLVELDKYFLHRAGTALIHGEAHPVPVGGDAHLVHLADDAVLILLFPLPGLLQEALPAQVMLVDALVLQLVDHLHLRGDGRVVGARLPESLEALHSLVADQNILHGVVQGVSHVQLSRHVGRGHHDGKGLLALSPSLLRVRVKILLVQPLLIEAALNLAGGIRLLQFFHTYLLSSYICLLTMRYSSFNR